jgi:hypothetical protein
MSEIGETYEYLKKLSKKDLTDVSFSRYQYPDIIVDIKYNYDSPSSSVVYFEFENNEEYFKILGIDNEEDIYVWDKFMGYYDYSYDYDSYRYEEDWREGYIIRQFSPENLNLVKEILRLVNPTMILHDDETDTGLGNIATYLNKRFDDIDYIISEYASLTQDCVRRAVIDVLKNETKNPFKKLGIIETYGDYKFKTTLGVLIHWYDTLDAKDFEIPELLGTMLKKYDRTDRGGWYELEYNAWCDDFDWDSFHKETARQLNDILEKVEEDLSEDVNFERYNELFNIVEKLGGFGRWIKIPSKKIEVYFSNIDIKTGKLSFTSRKPNHPSEDRSVDNVEDLNLSLYHPELFEQLKKIKGIIL